MGTNYYVNYNICKCCGRGEQVHIGKSSCGWKFLFYAPRKSEYGFNYETITSIDDWKKFLKENEHTIEDEYGKPIPDEDFWIKVEKKQNEKSHCENGNENYNFSKGGYDFTLSEFS